MSNTHPTSEALGTLFRTTQADLDAKGFKEYIQDYTKITTLTDLFEIPKGSRIRYKIKVAPSKGRSRNGKPLNNRTWFQRLRRVSLANAQKAKAEAAKKTANKA